LARADFVNHLESKKIQTRNYFSGNILFHRPYAHLGNPHDFPQACKVMEDTFFIGVHPMMTDPMIDYVQQMLDGFLKKCENHLSPTTTRPTPGKISAA